MQCAVAVIAFAEWRIVKGFAAFFVTFLRAFVSFLRVGVAFFAGLGNFFCILCASFCKLFVTLQRKDNDVG